MAVSVEVPVRRVGALEAPSLALAQVVAAFVVGGSLGVTLGWWCRTFAATRSVNGVLADLGAPWIAAAFVAGALVPAGRTTASVDRSIGTAGRATVIGAVAGATCLVVATVVYYGPARTGSLEIAGARAATLVWAGVGLGVGALFGALGRLGRTSSPTGSVVCLVALGTAITAESYSLLQSGVAGDETLVRNVLIGVALAGVAVPLLAGLRWPVLATSVLVAILAFPVSVVAEIVTRTATGSVSLLRAIG